MIVIVHADGAVWTRYYQYDLEAISDLFYVHLLSESDKESFLGEFALPERFDTAPLVEAGFYRTADVPHDSLRLVA